MTNGDSFKLTSRNPTSLASTAGYSQIVETSGDSIIFISGQTSVDPDGDTVGIGDFPAQASQVFQNLECALAEAGCNAGNLAKMTVFIRNMDSLSAYRDARDRFFESVTPRAAPAVTLVEVSRLYGPDFLIEIEGIAIK